MGPRVTIYTRYYCVFRINMSFPNLNLFTLNNLEIKLLFSFDDLCLGLKPLVSKKLLCVVVCDHVGRERRT